MSSAVLWFAAEAIPNTDSQVVYWRQYLASGHASSSAISLPQMIHDESERWKATYLQWLEAIGQTRNGDETLEEQLRLGANLSYWWMTVPTEYSFSEDALVYKAVRLWAFVELAERLGLTEVTLVGADPGIADVLRAWGKRTGRKILLRAWTSGVKPQLSLRRAVRDSSNVGLQMLFALRHLGKQYLEYGRRHKTIDSAYEITGYDLTIVDDLAHMLVDESQPNRYESHYWGQLPSQLASQGKSVHWIHSDYRSGIIPSSHEARRIVQCLNGNYANQRHSLLQDHMNLRVMAKTVICFLRIISLGLRVRRSRLVWLHHASEMNMWPLVKNSWRSSFYGATAAQNALWLQLFDFAVRERNPQNSCMYLMENQPWELALLSDWRESARGGIKGVVHSSVRPWDLRYALGCSAEQGNRHALLPRPDAILVNGPASLRILGKYGFNDDELIPVEALRYIRGEQTAGHASAAKESATSATRVLALGEYDPSLAAVQVEFLNELVEARGPLLKVTYRPHPGVVHESSSLDSRIELSRASSISADLAKSDVAFCGSTSSASLDALMSGVPVIVFKVGGVLDGQLLPEESVSATVTCSDELLDAVDALHLTRISEIRSLSEVFYLDAGLPRWATAVLA